MTPPNEIARLMRDNDRLAAHDNELWLALNKRDAEITRLGIENMRLNTELGNANAYLNFYKDGAERALKTLDTMVKNRNTYRSRADKLASWIDEHESDNETLMAYRQWRGDQP